LTGAGLEKSICGDMGSIEARAALIALAEIFGNSTAVVEERSSIFCTDGSFNSEAGIVMKSWKFSNCGELGLGTSFVLGP